ncbi:hypothetical protein [Pedobacter sp. L105]|uniref:hypothetical protein n=1 Tax=Pedobacter sp. L105 TaxID=1641871 RepID=UPI00131AA27E|nr:hypothetical protein [Pedobacter sp. L105]
MNNIFSFTRFSRLFNKHSREQFSTYLMSVAVLTGILSIVLGLFAYSNNGMVPVKIQVVYFFIFLIFSGTIFTSMIFSELGSKKKAIPALTLPISHFERFLVAWIYSFVIFQLLFILCFYAVDSVIIQIPNHYSLMHNELMKLSIKDPVVFFCYLAFIVLHSVAFLGAIYFEKLHFVKTTFVLFVFLALISMVNYGMIHSMFDATVHATAPFKNLYVVENTIFHPIHPNESADMIFNLMVCALTVLLWTTAYFKLKEKQV